MTDKFKNKYRTKSIRLQNWDYRWSSSYFITIITQKRCHFFGNNPKDEMNLSEIGKLANDYWIEIPKHFPFIELGAYVIMPNHMHGIITINNMDTLHSQKPITTIQPNVIDFLKQGKASISNNPEIEGIDKSSKMSNISPKQGSISTIIRSYKSIVTKSARKINSSFGWQARFHDNIIRNKKAYYKIENYIINNPKKWNNDKFNG
ncbi:transposase [Aureibaculum sp. A20]|uniref:Transposase n=1 Tax=Aureibaculum flavum TaxID=2795986 RepID=A0ABS0WUW0_9FLAO|nr:transposase [Aureibaculum flavum]MBJ2175735.1 transposase [Aureibaculum flavum]